MPQSTSLVPHAFATLLPAMADSDLASLRESLLADGYVGPPIYTFEGKILDGVHRHRLCVELEIDPPFVEYAGADAFRFALNQNLARRHLNESQRAMVAARLVTTKLGDNQFTEGGQICPPSTQPAASLLLKVSTRIVKSAQALLATKDTDSIAAVDAGDLRVSKALHTIKQAKAAKENKRLRKSPPKLPKDAPWQIILADPPWRYEHVKTTSRAIEQQYPTMPLSDICAMPVEALCADDAVLYLWATPPKLEEAFEVIRAWGFSYRTCAVWVKPGIGMGYWFRQRHEILLVSTRGTPGTPLESLRRDSVFECPTAAHSAKPAEVAELLEAQYPDLAKVELFSRSPRSGWLSHGTT